MNIFLNQFINGWGNSQWSFGLSLVQNYSKNAKITPSDESKGEGTCPQVTTKTCLLLFKYWNYWHEFVLCDQLNLLWISMLRVFINHDHQRVQCADCVHKKFLNPGTLNFIFYKPLKVFFFFLKTTGQKIFSGSVGTWLFNGIHWLINIF